MNEQFQKTHLAHGVEKTEYETQYDENVKALLADKQVLARLAKHRIEEFRDYTIEEIIDCIEGDPEISSVSIYPGKKTDAISGMNVESKERREGEVTFDVRFYMLTKEQKRVKIIVNLEAQRDYYPGYHFEARAVFYCARMLSEQLDREFTADDYDGLKKVYSIWIFFHAPIKESDTITEYHMSRKDVYGAPVKGGKYDYLSISFLRLSLGRKESKDQLLRMLDTLFSDTMDADQKKRLLETEHQMVMTRKLEGEIGIMCNVSQGIKMRALEEGVKKGLEKGYTEAKKELIRKKLAKGKSLEEIADALEEDLETVREMVSKL